jgi:hypothetical protein
MPCCPYWRRWTFDHAPPDAYAFLMDLPFLLGTTDATIPAPIPYLSADSRRLAARSRRLGAWGSSLKIGVVWAASSTGYAPRSCRAAEFAEFASLTALNLVVSVNTSVAHRAGALGRPV